MNTAPDPGSEPHGGAYPPGPGMPGRRSPAAQRVPIAFIWAAVVMTAGGFGCGYLVTEFGELGSISLWGLGFLAGLVSRKITVGPSPVIAWTLVIALCMAMLIAETCWIRWKTIPGQQGWADSIALLPTFFRDYKLSAAMAALFTGFGAYSAYWQAGKRFRRVYVVEE